MSEIIEYITLYMYLIKKKSVAKAKNNNVIVFFNAFKIHVAN